MNQSDQKIIERHLLGCIIMQPDIIATRSTDITTDLFTIFEHKKIFAAIEQVYKSGNEIVFVSINGVLNNLVRSSSLGLKSSLIKSEDSLKYFSLCQYPSK